MHPFRREAAIAFCASTELVAHADHTISSTVLSVEGEPIALDWFTLEEFLQAKKNELCRKCADLVGRPPINLNYDRDRILVRKLKVKENLQRNVLARLHLQLLRPTHYLVVLVHQRGGRM